MIRYPFNALFGKNRVRDQHPGHRTARRRAFALGPEVLENRTVLSSFTVMNNLNSGPGSLRQAVLDANGATGSDTILFAKSVHNITLTSGELAITGDLKIVGPGAKEGDHQRQSHWSGLRHYEWYRRDHRESDRHRRQRRRQRPVYPSCGGGILNLGSLTLDQVVIDSNKSVGDPNVVVAGSAIFNSLGGRAGRRNREFRHASNHRQHDFQ